MSKPQLRSEVVNFGQNLGGTINVIPRGYEVFGPTGAYVCTATTIQHARQILFEMHQDGEKGSAEE